VVSKRCPHCFRLFCEKGIGTHIWRKHTEEGRAHRFPAWNKGLTKESDKRMKSISDAMKLAHKEGRAKVYFPSWLGRRHKPETIVKLSKAMRKAIAEGRGNIWKGTPSYPEKFFMKVIENEFKDKAYKFNLRQGRYKIDFAWVDKMKCIEIDGEQHNFSKQKDEERDEFLGSKGWNILRIKWIDLFNNTKKWIRIANKFVGK